LEKSVSSPGAKHTQTDQLRQISIIVDLACRLCRHHEYCAKLLIVTIQSNHLKSSKFAEVD